MIISAREQRRDDPAPIDRPDVPEVTRVSTAAADFAMLGTSRVGRGVT